MEMYREREIRQQLLDEMIAEVEKSIHQFRRTLDGLQQRIIAEERQRELLERKRNALAHDAEAAEDSGGIAFFVTKILLERGEPMRVREIVQALVENGITSGTGDAPVNSVLSALCRRVDLFERVSRGHYALKEAHEKSEATSIASRSLQMVNS